MKGKIILFILGFLVWMLMTWPMDLQNAIVGVLVAGFVAILTGNMFIRRPTHFKRASRYLWFGYYIPLFLWECFKANVDVALRILNPKLPINPGIVKVKTTLKSDTALTFLANSITLTPGTLSVDIDKEEGLLYVHWINVKSQKQEEATEIIVQRFERILKKIFE